MSRRSHAPSAPWRARVGAAAGLSLATWVAPHAAHASPLAIAAEAAATPAEPPAAPEAPAVDPKHANDATEFSIGFGALLSYGNSNSLAISGTTGTRVRRGIHQFTGGIITNNGVARASRNDVWLTNARNTEGKLRYDAFVHERVSIYTMVTLRNDVFQGLQLRTQLDPGVSVTAVNRDSHTLKFEVGYNLQLDYRYPQALYATNPDGKVVLDAMGQPTVALDRFFVNNSARFATAYLYKLDDRLTIDTGLEFFQSFKEVDRWRLNAWTALVVSLPKGFSLNTRVDVKYDDLPLPGVQKLDVITSLLVGYSYKR